MRALLICVLGLVMLLAPRSAQASCEDSQAHLTPSDGTPLPPRGTIYLFAAKHPYYYASDTITVEKAIALLSVRGASFSARVISSTFPRYVVRIDYLAEGSSITLRWRDWSSTHPISAPSAVNHACVIGMEHLQAQSGCAAYNSIDVLLRSNAIAYRVDWEDGTTTFLADQFFTSDPSLDTPLSQLVRLGHYSCLGYNVDPALLADLRSFQLFALFADGTEAAFPLASTRLEDYAVTLPTELLHATARPSPSALLAPAPLATHLLSLSAVRGLLVVLAFLGVAVLAFLTRRVIRRRLDHVPR